MSNKVTYTDKVGLVPKTIAINQWQDVDANEVKSVHNLNDDRITNIEDNQVTGVETYSTKASLPATGVLLTSYKVTNDPTTSNNGYWHWDGSAYVQDVVVGLFCGELTWDGTAAFTEPSDKGVGSYYYKTRTDLNKTELWVWNDTDSDWELQVSDYSYQLDKTVEDAFDVTNANEIARNVQIMDNGSDAYAHARRVDLDLGDVFDLFELDSVIRKNRNASLLMAPHSIKAGKLYSQLPVNGNGDFTVTRASIRDVFNKYRVTEARQINEPRFDYQKKFVAPTDNSYYDFNGTSSKIVIPSQNIGTVHTLISKINSDNYIDDLLLNGSGLTNYFYCASSTSIEYKAGGTGVVFTGLTLPSSGTNVEIAIQRNGTLVKLFIDGVQQGGDKTMASNTDFTFDGISNHTGNFFEGGYLKHWSFNTSLSDADILSSANGIYVIPYKYVGATNLDVTADSVTIGKQFRIVTIGTTDWTLHGASANTVGVEFTATGIGVGTGTATSIGNTINLSTGKTTAKWYDLDHDAISTVTGATLTASNNFSKNAHGVYETPALLTEPDATMMFLNSKTPVTQTVTTVVGTTYTVNCQNKGIITLDETGGNGRGGTATEVNSFTWTATTTSMVITLVAGHSFDWVQMSNTAFPLRHCETAGVSLAVSKDQITGGGTVAEFDSEQGVLEVDIASLFDSLSDRAISISDGTANNVVSISYNTTTEQIEFNVTVGGVVIYTHSETVSDTTAFAVYSLKYAEANFGVKVNSVEVDTQDTGIIFAANVLTSLQMNSGAGADSFVGLTSSIKALPINEY